MADSAEPSLPHWSPIGAGPETDARKGCENAGAAFSRVAILGARVKSLGVLVSTSFMTRFAQTPPPEEDSVSSLLAATVILNSWLFYRTPDVVVCVSFRLWHKKMKTGTAARGCRTEKKMKREMGWSSDCWNKKPPFVGRQFPGHCFPVSSIPIPCLRPSSFPTRTYGFLFCRDGPARKGEYSLRRHRSQLLRSPGTIPLQPCAHRTSCKRAFETKKKKEKKGYGRVGG